MRLIQQAVPDDVKKIFWIWSVSPGRRFVVRRQLSSRRRRPQLGRVLRWSTFCCCCCIGLSFLFLGVGVKGRRVKHEVHPTRLFRASAGRETSLVCPAR